MSTPDSNELSGPEESVLNKLTDEQIREFANKMNNIKVAKPGPFIRLRNPDVFVMRRFAATNYPDITWVEIVAYLKVEPYVKTIALFNVKDIGLFQDLAGKGGNNNHEHA